MSERASISRVLGILAWGIVIAILLTTLMLPLAAAKKKKKQKRSERLKEIETVYVVGSGLAVDYVRRGLMDQTCFRPAPRNEADAKLEIFEDLNPCRGGARGLCLGISATLRDMEGKKRVLWFRRDDDFAPARAFGVSQKAAEWVLWSLGGTPCKGRGLP